MTIVCIGYFDKFSRFFLDIKSQLSATQKSQLIFKIYSVYFSGFLYTLLRLNFSVWLPLKAWFLVARKRRYYKTIINSNSVYKDLEYTKCIQFHLGLQPAISKKALQLQALAYIDIFHSLFHKLQPDFLLCFGDSRLAFEVAIAIAKQHNIKTYYLEQGPFNTTFFDDAGSNANLSIRNSIETPNLVISKGAIAINAKTETYQRSPLYRGFDMLFRFLFERTILYPPDIKFTDLNTYKRKPHKTNSLSLPNDKPIVLLICQVPLDVNMIYHSKHYKTHVAMLKAVQQNLSEDTILIVREHPLFVNKYAPEFYEYIQEHQISIDNTNTLNTALNAAHVVVVNNSTVGLESILQYKTTVVLGDAFYDNDRVCLKFNNTTKLKSLLQNALEYTPDKIAIDDFKALLYNKILLQGAVTDKHLKSSKTIAKLLLETT